MFVSRRDTNHDDVRERFIRVVGLPALDDLPVDAATAAVRPGLPSAGDSRLSDRPGGPGGTPAGDPPVFAEPTSAERLPAECPPAGSSPAGSASVGSASVGLLGAFDPGRRGVRALILVAVIGVVVAGFVAWRSRPQIDPVTAARTESSTPLSGPSAGPTGVVVVAVTGRVRHPGLIRLAAGARVADAIEAAGGAQPDTDLSFVNLARKLLDGELLAIGVTPPPGVAIGPEGAGPGTSGAAPAGPLNVNVATAAQFETLPGIGPVLAQHIVDYRTRHGQFRSVDELRQVEGLGAARFAQIKPLVTM